jgi:hypothetical protein
MAAPATGQTLERRHSRSEVGRQRITSQPEIQLFALADMAQLFPTPTNATNQPLDWTTYKLWIRNGSGRRARRLLAPAESEENLTTLALDIVAAILDETLPPHVTVHDLAISPPLLWEEQRKRIGGAVGGRQPE